MKKTFKYRIYADKETLSKAVHWLTLCRHLYNAGLEQRITVHRQNKGHISCYDQIKQLPELKVSFPEYSDVGSQVLQEVLERLDKAYDGFFRRVKHGGKVGFPRFKGRDRYDSFTLKQAGWKLDGKYLSISKVGRFKLRLSREIKGNIKTVTIRRESSGKWYACFSCDSVPEKRLPESDVQIGLDVGIKSFLVDSEGSKVDNPQYLRHSERILRRRQRKLSRRVKGSNSRRQARVLVAKSHDKVRSQRNDFLHKLANQYVSKYGTIYIEDLNIKGMVRNKHLSKSISDSSWGKFFELLTYKAEEAGRKVIKVSPNNTSQICSECGEKVEKSLAVRTHRCPYCGLVLDRDENAARNILQVGQTYQELTWQNTACVS
jgi:putative transposase